jgi:hypothetical protein
MLCINQILVHIRIFITHSFLCEAWRDLLATVTTRTDLHLCAKPKKKQKASKNCCQTTPLRRSFPLGRTSLVGTLFGSRHDTPSWSSRRGSRLGVRLLRQSGSRILRRSGGCGKRNGNDTKNVLCPCALVSSMLQCSSGNHICSGERHTSCVTQICQKLGTSGRRGCTRKNAFALTRKRLSESVVASTI